MHLHVAVERVAPGQMRVDEEHRVAARRFGRADRPGVGSRRKLVVIGRGGPSPRSVRALILEQRSDFRVHPRARAHVAVMHGAQRMLHDVDARHGQHDTKLGADRARVLRRKLVDTARKLVQVLAELRILRVVPAFRALRHSVQLHPSIELEVGVAAPVFRRTPARFAVQDAAEGRRGFASAPSHARRTSTRDRPHRCAAHRTDPRESRWTRRRWVVRKRKVVRSRARSRRLRHRRA